MQDEKIISKYQKFNKLLVRKCIEYYFDQQQEMNKLMHDLRKQKEFLIIQAKRLKEDVEVNGKSSKHFINAYLIKKEGISIEYLKDQIQTVSNLLKSKIENKLENIKQYFFI